MATFPIPPHDPVQQAPASVNVAKRRPARHRRYKAAVACITCRSRKVKCDGARPVCGRCQRKADLRGQCSYIRTSTAETQASPFPSQTPPKQEPPPSQPYDQGLPGPFASKVSAAINAKVGLSNNETQPTLLLDAPLFGSFRLSWSPDWSQLTDKNVLPTRKHADELLSSYWRDLESIEPVLDRESFYLSYQALYAGGDLNIDCEERIFVSTLNVVFALASQLQESVPSEQRDNASSAFFSRACCLLQPESIVWEPGSVELIRCLLLMSRYLQCTSNSHQTSMILGSAVRMAQNLDFHLPKPISRDVRDVVKRRELWHQCAYLDRSLSWSLGKPLALYLVSTQLQPISTTGTNRPPNVASLSARVSDSLMKLDEMTGHILLAERLANTSFGQAVGLPSSPSKWDTATAMHLEDGLSKLSASFEQEVALHAPDACPARRIRLFRLRLAHARILLFRPMLARLCLTPQCKTSENNSLHGHLLQSCASLCVENTARMLSLVCETCATTPGLLPWWYRVFYLFVSSQHLLAAMLRPEVFGAQVYELWGTASLNLAAHEHLSPAVKHCSSNFTRLAQRIRNTHSSTEFASTDHASADAQEEGAFQDIFQQFGFDLDGRLFDFEDSTSWPTDWNM